MPIKVSRRRLMIIIASIIALSLLSACVAYLSSTLNNNCMDVTNNSLSLAWSVYNGLEMKVEYYKKVVKPLNLLESVKPLNVETKLLKSNEIVQILYKNRQVMQVVKKFGGLGKIDAAQLIKYNGRELLVLFMDSDVKLTPVVIDIATGKVLPAKLILIKRYSERVPITTSTSTEGVKYARLILELLRTSGVIAISEQLIQRAITTYMQLQAYREVNITSYKLVVQLGDNSRYTTLGYYIDAGACGIWSISGYVVYKVCAKGRFYVNPGKEVKLVADKSYYKVNPPFVNCDFKKERYTTDISASIRADGLAALIDCPITTKLSAWAVIAVDKWGNVDNDTDGCKWIDLSCGCWPPT